MTTEPRNDERPPARAAGGHARQPQSSLAGLKPFLLAGLLVVIGLLVGLNFLLGGSGESSAPSITEPVPGAMTIGPPPGGELSEQEAPRSATAPSPPDHAAGSTPAGSAPVSPSEFTFYETLKKPSNDPAGTVGLSPSNTPAKPSKSTVSAPAPSPRPAAAPKPAPTKNRVIDTTTAENGGLHYTVQVGAFRQQAQAEEMIKGLNKRGHEAYLATASSSDGDGKTYRVRVGRFTTREAADRAAKRLAAREGLHPFIATIDPGASKKS
jgi:cell division septation protein DedD